MLALGTITYTELLEVYDARDLATIDDILRERDEARRIANPPEPGVARFH